MKGMLAKVTKTKMVMEIMSAQCDLQTTLMSNLKEHIKSKHGGEKYPCDQCDQIFNLKGSLRNHRIYRHIGINTKGRTYL